MLGILVSGDNHFIVRGPRPSLEEAVALGRHWSVIQIGTVTPDALTRWQIVSKAYRENLRWAVVVPGDGGMSSAVVQLLRELAERGVVVEGADWAP